MRRKNVYLAGIAAGAAALLLCGCSASKADEGKQIQVGVACYDKSDTFISSLIDCYREQIGQYREEGLSVTVTVLDAAGLQRTQNDQIKELLDAGCNVLCVNLVDRTDPSEIIDLARDRDVPIIFFNREPVAEDMSQWSGLYYVGAYAEQSGIMQGELAAEYIKENEDVDRNGDGKIQYVVLEGEPGHQDAIIRTENAVDTLKKNDSRLEKLSYGIANWSRAQAQNRMTQMIGQYPNEIELVLANNDDMILGAIDAYESLNIAEEKIPVFFGIDGTDVGLEAVLDGKVAGTVYNDKEGQAQAMVKLTAALITGEGMDEIAFENEHYIYLPYAKITKENAADFQEREAETGD